MKPLKPLLAISSLVLLAAPAPAEIVERVIAKVNGDIITQSEFEARQVAAVRDARVPPERIEFFLRENNARILQEAIDELLLLQKAYELGMRLRPEYIREVIEGIKKENNIESDEALQEQLRREGMSLDDLKRNIERSVLVRQVRARELESKVGVSEVDARAEYEARKADFTRPATLRLQEIVLKGPGARERAHEIVARARSGEEFASLARAHSVSPTRDSGGDLGRLARGELNPELERIAFSLEPGGVSEPIPTADTFRILRVVEKTEASLIPFEEAKADILGRLSQARFAEVYERYMEGLRKDALIDIRVREVPLQVDLPAEGPSLPAAGERQAVPGAPEGSEFRTTPQAQPERVAPPPAPGDPRARDKKKEDEKPAPVPSPPPQG